MHLEQLLTMANQIGGFFEGMPDRQEAMTGVMQHLRNYWDPRMRRQLLKHIADDNGEGLTPFTLEALRLHVQELTPATPAAPAAPVKV